MLLLGTRRRYITYLLFFSIFPPPCECDVVGQLGCWSSFSYRNGSVATAESRAHCLNSRESSRNVIYRRYPNMILCLSFSAILLSSENFPLAHCRKWHRNVEFLWKLTNCHRNWVTTRHVPCKHGFDEAIIGKNKRNFFGPSEQPKQPRTRKKVSFEGITQRKEKCATGFPLSDEPKRDENSEKNHPWLLFYYKRVSQLNNGGEHFVCSPNVVIASGKALPGKSGLISMGKLKGLSLFKPMCCDPVQGLI